MCYCFVHIWLGFAFAFVMDAVIHLIGDVLCWVLFYLVAARVIAVVIDTFSLKKKLLRDFIL